MAGDYMFISYSHRDAPIVLSFVRQLQHDGYRFWIDRRIRGGSRWNEELARRIRECTCCVLFVSHCYVESENCTDEWTFAKTCRKPIIRIHIDDVELPDVMNFQLNGYQYLSYDASAQFWADFYHSVNVDRCKSEKGDSETNLLEYNGQLHTIDFSVVIQKLCQWLTTLSCRWGAMDTASEPQHANTCEGLLAMKLSGYDVIRKHCFSNAWSFLRENMTERGLSSKSLGKETVVCTSMLLMLAALERERLSPDEKAVFDEMASQLWAIRNKEYGWGVFVSPTEEENCSYANTAWALKALNEYQHIRETEEFYEYCQEIFESERDGTFSFFRGGQPKLMVTAMYVGLYYRMDSERQVQLKEFFDKAQSLRFIYSAFVKKNVQTEQETLYGIDTDGVGPKKVPWNHITVWPALDALSQAYYNGDLEEEKWQNLLIHTERMVEENVRRAGNEIYYQPEGMEESRKGHFTFPTMYLIMGLSQLVMLNA